MRETACAAFEDRLLEYDALAPPDRVAVDEHLLGCAACRNYRQLLEHIDTAMAEQLHTVRLNTGHLEEIRRLVTLDIPVTRVSKMPEWLDLIAVGAVFAFVYRLAWQTGLVAYIADAMRSTLN